MLSFLTVVQIQGNVIKHSLQSLYSTSGITIPALVDNRVVATDQQVSGQYLILITPPTD